MSSIGSLTLTDQREKHTLFSLTQAGRSVTDYVIDFRDPSWLPKSIKDELATQDLPKDLKDLIDLATRIDWQI